MVVGKFGQAQGSYAVSLIHTRKVRVTFQQKTEFVVSPVLLRVIGTVAGGEEPFRPENPQVVAAELEAQVDLPNSLASQ